LCDVAGDDSEFPVTTVPSDDDFRHTFGERGQRVLC
jgi:hypothetical protein